MITLQRILHNICRSWHRIPLSVLIMACSFSCTPLEDDDICYDFLRSFNAAVVSPDTSLSYTPNSEIAFSLGYGANFSVPMAGESRPAIVILAGGEVTYNVPADEAGGTLYFGIALIADSDGAFGIVTVESEGKKDTVYQRFLHPRYRPEDRRWFDEFVDLSTYRNKAMRVTFSLVHGPFGYDYQNWSAWSTPILTHCQTTISPAVVQ